jgi:transcriptional regulator with XRE-family HTH domain
MSGQNGRAFNEWLRAQLKAKKMSQRQLAQQSGVDHSTISRLIRGDRMPSLGTATKLARGLRELRDDADAPYALGVMTSGTANPTARVEYALRSDEVLSEAQVRQIMEYYLAVRLRRLGRAYGTGEPARPATASSYLRGNLASSGTVGAGPAPVASVAVGVPNAGGLPLASRYAPARPAAPRSGAARPPFRPPPARPTNRY